MINTLVKPNQYTFKLGMKYKLVKSYGNDVDINIQYNIYLYMYVNIQLIK